MNKKELFEYMKIKKNETPKTNYISYPKSVKVTLLDYPDEKRIKKTFVNAATSSWFPNYAKDLDSEAMNEEIEDLLSGKTLGLGIEMAQFTFLVEGISLHDSQALVRNRIGITYASQSQAVRDLRHDNILIPNSYNKYPVLLERYKKWAEDGKAIYAELLDTDNISVNDARLSLPKTIPVWIVVSCNLMTLTSLLEKRLDTQEESIGLNAMANQIVKLVVDKFPYMEFMLKSACEKGKCFHQRKGWKANCIYKRDKLHSIEGYEDEFTLHDKTKEELSKGL